MVCRLCGGNPDPLVDPTTTTTTICAECLGIVTMMIDMQESERWSNASTTVPVPVSYKQTQFRGMRGPPIPWLLERIETHEFKASLSDERLERLAKIGRFDRRRSTADNNYVRETWTILCDWTNNMMQQRQYQSACAINVSM